MAAMQRLEEQQAARLEREIAGRMDGAILERGFRYFREGRVFVTEVVEGNAIYGAVNGSAVYAVMLDADEFTYSTCTCPYQGYCKHMAAVFFQYCAASGEDAEHVHGRMSGRLPAWSAASSAPSDAGAPPSEPGPGDGPAAWRAWFERRYGEVWRQCRHSLHPFQPVLQELKGRSRDWDKRLQRLHWLEAIAFVLTQVERAYEASDVYNRYYYEMTFSRSVEPWLGHFNELVAELEPSRMGDDERIWLDDLNETLRAASLRDDYKLLRWDFMYHVLWERMAADGEARRRERQTLRRLLASPGLGDRQAAALQAACAHLDFRDGSDADAIAAMARTPFERYSLTVYAFAEERLADGRFGALRLWMDWIAQQLADCRNLAVLRPFLRLCREADIRQPDTAHWTRLMTRHLPYSYPELSAHWLERGRYEEWSELQLLMGIRPDELDAQDLRVAARSAPALLIPMYHQAIDESIQTRNRQGYRAAVKLMKRLEKLYQAAGRSAVWQRYLKHATGKYMRLRALQEEMRKGKLTP